MEYMKEKKTGETKEEKGLDQSKDGPKSSEWATEALEELDEFIESQGIYIRQ